MSRTRLNLVGLLAAGLSAGGCAGDTGSPIDGDGGVPVGDGGSPCYGEISFTPDQPLVGSDVTARVELVNSDVPVTFTWSVVDPMGNPLDCSGDAGADSGCEPQADGSLRIHVEQPDIYVVDAEVHGEVCPVSTGWLSVGVPGANDELFRVRFTPPPGQAAPPQERTIAVAGGADSVITGALESGVTVTGNVVDHRGQGVAAYLRFTRSGGATVETFSGDGGVLVVQLAPGDYDLLVVPAIPDEASAAGLAPARLAVTASTANLAALLPDDTAIDGTLVDSAGVAIADATVSLRVGGVPSTLARTDAAGHFALRARPPGALEVVVVPPPGLGLPRLEIGVDAGVSLAGAASLDLRYDAIATRELGGTVIADSASAPVVSAPVTLIAEIAAAGSVGVGDTSVVARGTVRIATTTGADGALPALQVPAAPYRLVLRPPSGAAVASADLGSAVPATITAAPRVTVTGQLIGADGLAVPAGHVTAVPTGDLAGVDGGGASGTAGDGGAFSLEVVGGQRYDLIATAAGKATVRLPIEVGPDGGAIDPVRIPDALRLRGSLDLPSGGPAAGVNVALFCYDCTGAAAWRPLAEAVTGLAGNYLLLIPDPGVTTDGGP